jgi:hypothetical protein
MRPNDAVRERGRADGQTVRLPEPAKPFEYAR